MANAIIRVDQDIWITERLGSPDTFFCTRGTFVKLSEFCCTKDEPDTGEDQVACPRRLATPMLFQENDIALQEVKCATIVTERIIDLPQAYIGPDLEVGNPEDSSEFQCSLPNLDALIVVSHDPQAIGFIR